MQKIWLRFLGSLLLLFSLSSFQGQGPNWPTPSAAPLVFDDYPKDYFSSPVNDQLRLSGTFGELRPDHFHTGIDIKSKTGRIGQPVLAAADGFVDRIKVQAGGYGNVLYIKHPNGYTTLYGHLDRFAPEIQNYVRQFQYKRESFEIELQPTDGQFKVKKGQEIGKLGNTGGSSGPHLHFEIRNSATDKVLNPLLFGLPVIDLVPPEVRDMKVYFLNDKREVLSSQAFPIQRRADGTLGIAGDTVRLAAWRVGFGIKVYDHMTGLSNDNGIYSLQLQANEQLAFQWKMDQLDFDESRYVNAHIDYPVRQQYGAWFHRCFVLPGDHLANYTRTESMGSIPLSRDYPMKISIQAADPAGNKTTVTFWALRNDSIAPSFSPPYQYELPFNQENKIALPGFSLTMPQGALYETLPFQYKTTPDESAGIYSPTYHLHNGRTPAHRYFEVAIQPQGLPPDLRSKACIAYCGSGRPANCGGLWRDDMLVTKVREFGDYSVMVDTVPPRITPAVFSADMRKKNTLSFRIRDNFGTGGSADGMSYRGTIDGKWVLFEYDRKNARLTYVFDDRVAVGQHKVVMQVTDDLGNVGIWEGKFRK